jgi:hypothetical protein
MSIVTGIANKVKACIAFPRKNMELAQNAEFRDFMSVLFEQVLPQHLSKLLKEN